MSLDYACVACTDGAVLAACMTQSKLNLACRSAFIERHSLAARLSNRARLSTFQGFRCATVNKLSELKQTMTNSFQATTV